RCPLGSKGWRGARRGPIGRGSAAMNRLAEAHSPVQQNSPRNRLMYSSIVLTPATAPETEEVDRAALAAKLAYATPENAPLVPGRRAFFKYRDLGVTDATDGRMRAQLTIGTGEMQQTGWHYHLCEAQFIYTLRGWVDLVFED